MVQRRNIRLLTTILFSLIFIVYAHAQGTKVYSEGGENSPVDQQRENGIHYMEPVYSNMKIARDLMAQSGDLINTATSEADIDKALELARKAKSHANMGSAALNKIYQGDDRAVPGNILQEFKTLSERADYYNANRTRWVSDMERAKRENANDIPEETEQRNHESRMSNLESEIASEDQKINAIDQQLNALDAELSVLNKPKKNQNIEDFLATMGKSKTNGDQDDFLASPSKSSSGSSANGDFLSSGSSSNNGDFLTEMTSASDDYIIDKQNDKQGVKSKSGKILIPYRNWQIKEYKGGIARVQIMIDNKSFECGGQAYIYKAGYVDRSGNFLDGYDVSSDHLVFIDPYTQYTGIRLVSGNESVRNRERNREELKRKRELEYRKKAEKMKSCEAEMKAWEIQRIKYYSNR